MNYIGNVDRLVRHEELGKRFLIGLRKEVKEEVDYAMNKNSNSAV